VIAIFAWRVTLNYADSSFKNLLLQVRSTGSKFVTSITINSQELQESSILEETQTKPLRTLQNVTMISTSSLSTTSTSITSSTSVISSSDKSVVSIQSTETHQVTQISESAEKSAIISEKSANTPALSSEVQKENAKQNVAEIPEIPKEPVSNNNEALSPVKPVEEKKVEKAPEKKAEKAAEEKKAEKPVPCKQNKLFDFLFACFKCRGGKGTGDKEFQGVQEENGKDIKK